MTREPRLWPWSALLVGMSIVELAFGFGNPWLWAGFIVLAIAGGGRRSYGGGNRE